MDLIYGQASYPESDVYIDFNVQVARTVTQLSSQRKIYEPEMWDLGMRTQMSPDINMLWNKNNMLSFVVFLVYAGM